ncbi:hypothetical protein QBC42DRAFT_346602 [Cladorrhinum samala]|uniref:Uncharacterized protein n=1 Tax=Cladorrhinum samala TaxID=585594 RepID=A0AAV9HP30_9PEZI|nr:hypothetical protein QBC42DRAFT_346602 [Cladorrhinum samala]
MIFWLRPKCEVRAETLEKIFPGTAEHTKKSPLAVVVVVGGVPIRAVTQERGQDALTTYPDSGLGAPLRTSRSACHQREAPAEGLQDRGSWRGTTEATGSSGVMVDCRPQELEPIGSPRVVPKKSASTIWYIHASPVGRQRGRDKKRACPGPEVLGGKANRRRARWKHKHRTEPASRPRGARRAALCRCAASATIRCRGLLDPAASQQAGVPKRRLTGRACRGPAQCGSRRCATRPTDPSPSAFPS